jgi:hypothetical protein
LSDNLTFADLLKARDTVFPPLYYATSEEVERGKILLAAETEHSPEYIVFHPDNLEDVQRSITDRRLVHLRELGP